MGLSAAAAVVGVGLKAAVAAGWVAAVVASVAVVGLAGSNGSGALSEQAATMTTTAARAADSTVAVWRRMFIGIDVLVSVALYPNTIA